MALSPLPPSNTVRYKLRYSAGGIEHGLISRFDEVNDTIANSELQTFLSLAEPLLATISIVGLEWAPVGSDIFNPTPWTGNATYGAGALPDINKPWTLSFVGRSRTARKSRVFLYGIKTLNDASYRIHASENEDVAAVTGFLQTAAHGFRTIDGTQAVWAAYANLGANDHWVGDQRVSGGTA